MYDVVGDTNQKSSYPDGSFWSTWPDLFTCAYLLSFLNLRVFTCVSSFYLVYLSRHVLRLEKLFGKLLTDQTMYSNPSPAKITALTRSPLSLFCSIFFPVYCIFH